MQIQLSSTVPPALIEPDDFKAFKIAAHGPEDPGWLADAARSLGRAQDTTHVFVQPEALRALAGERSHDASWLAQLDAMVEFASSHGWVDEDGCIRAHVDWVSRPASRNDRLENPDRPSEPPPG